MLPFFGKIVLLIAAAFGLGTLAGRRRRKRTGSREPVPVQAGQDKANSATPPAVAARQAGVARPASPSSPNGGASPSAARNDPPTPSPFPASTTPADVNATGLNADGETEPATSGSAAVANSSEAPSSRSGAMSFVSGDDDNDDDRDGGEALAASARLVSISHVPKSLPDDPLTEKYRAEPFRRNFRSVDYSKLSLDEEAIEAERKRRRQHSSWHAPRRAKQKPAVQEASSATGTVRQFSGRFASFGGATVSADVIMGGNAGIVPDMTPTLPGDDPDSPTMPAVPDFPTNQARQARPAPVRLGAPHPDLPTAPRSKRAAAPPDPLVEKHRAAPFDRDWRTLDHGGLDEDAAATRKSKSHDWSPRTVAREAKAAAEARASGAERPAAYPAAFSALGVAAAVPGAPDLDASTRVDSGRGTGVSRPSGAAARALGAPGAHEGVMGLEPKRIDAPRGDRPDDLTRIKGIGPTIERLLFEHGVYHFDQIAGWSAAEAQWIEQMIGFVGRVERENWVAQAKGFATGAEN